MYEMLKAAKTSNFELVFTTKSNKGSCQTFSVNTSNVFPVQFSSNLANPGYLSFLSRNC